MTTKAILFYGGQVVQRFEPGENVSCSYLLHTQWGSEVYNGGYIYWPGVDHDRINAWYRCDLTPVLLADVPKEYRLLALIHS